MENQQYVLLMTACICPSDQNLKRHDIHRSDPSIRLNDYKMALSFWLSYDETRITGVVFVENSGYDLIELKKIANEKNVYNKSVEFLQFEASEIPKGLHYGYAELEIIDYAIDHSVLLKASDYMIKATGRLVFPKLSALIKTISNECDFLSDCKDYNFLNKSHHYVVSTIFIVKTDFYKKTLYRARERMVEMGCGLLEVLYFNILKPMHLKNPKQIRLRLPFNVDPVGVGGHLNVNYLSRKNRLLSSFRGIARTLVPALWI